jgi:hypothetical protein
MGGSDFPSDVSHQVRVMGDMKGFGVSTAIAKA